MYKITVINIQQRMGMVNNESDRISQTKLVKTQRKKISKERLEYKQSEVVPIFNQCLRASKRSKAFLKSINESVSMPYQD